MITLHRLRRRARWLFPLALWIAILKWGTHPVMDWLKAHNKLAAILLALAYLCWREDLEGPPRRRPRPLDPDTLRRSAAL